MASVEGRRRDGERGIRSTGLAPAADEREGLERLRFALGAARVGVWDWNVATGEMYRSHEFERLHDLHPGGGLDALIEDVHHEDRRRVLDTLAAAIDGERDYRVEFRLLRRGGECLWVELRGRAFYDAAGEPAWMTGVCHDITERKHAELALQDSEAQLRRQAERLAEADRRKDEFLAMLAHELRNPLTPIVGAAQLLGRRGHEPGQVDRAIEVLGRQVEQLRKIVDDLLDVGRITRGRIVLDRRIVDARDVVELALESAEPLVRERRHVLIKELPSRSMPVLVDPVRLGQVVANILNNAAKYTPDGGRIHVSMRCCDGWLELVVRDDGIGISAQMLPHIFDAFTQGRQGLDRAEGGLGLGLKLAQQLTQLHGGVVEARSEGRGQGSTFVVRIPARTWEDVVMETPERDSTVHKRPRRVLVVDDSVDLAETLAMVLEESGHEVRLAHNGHAALAEFDEFEPEIVFLDIGLPEMNGYEVARELRAREAGRSVLLLALSGYGEREDRDEAEAAGFDRHLLKPVDIETIEEVIEVYERAR
jgi:signal transduction histidine kinase/CheY-like chemotaxis protein